MTLTVTQVVGVCTDSHVTVRAMLMNSASLKVVILIVLIITDLIMSLKGIKFPIISDRDGDFSRAFGVLKLSGGNFGAARAVFHDLSPDSWFLFLSQVAVLDPEMRLIHMSLRNERTCARFLFLVQSTIMLGHNCIPSQA